MSPTIPLLGVRGREGQRVCDYHPPNGRGNNGRGTIRSTSSKESRSPPKKLVLKKGTLTFRTLLHPQAVDRKNAKINIGLCLIDEKSLTGGEQKRSQ